jgi:hypothetical protein
MHRLLVASSVFALVSLLPGSASAELRRVEIAILGMD